MAALIGCVQKAAALAARAAPCLPMRTPPAGLPCSIPPCRKAVNEFLSRNNLKYNIVEVCWAQLPLPGRLTVDGRQQQAVALDGTGGKSLTC